MFDETGIIPVRVKSWRRKAPKDNLAEKLAMIYMSIQDGEITPAEAWDCLNSKKDKTE